MILINDTFEGKVIELHCQGEQNYECVALCSIPQLKVVQCLHSPLVASVFSHLSALRFSPGFVIYPS